jgi:secreted trypsin-like serine protease
MTALPRRLAAALALLAAVTPATLAAPAPRHAALAPAARLAQPAFLTAVPAARHARPTRAWLAAQLGIGRPHVSLFAGKVIGGSPAPAGALPALAFVVATDGQYIYNCTGEVISPTVVLTAAHCLYDRTGAPFAVGTLAVVTGRTDATDTTVGEAQWASGMVADPYWDPTTARDDAAVITLGQAVPEPPLRLATYLDAAALAAGATGTIAGWGDTYDGQPSIQNVLMEGQVQIGTDAYCAGFTPDYVASAMLCADGGGRAVVTCHGDSGGPLLVTTAASETIIAAITSWGSPDGCQVWPSYFTRGAEIADWVLPQIGQTPPW